ncbi:MAG: hypothetical protein EOO24_58145, partial [Comamonadaceae bacterium]
MKTVDSPAATAGQQDVRTLLRGLHELRQSQVDPAYWASFCQLIASLCRGRGSVVVERDGTGEWAATSSTSS